MNYNENEYKKFLTYVKSTFGQLLENDWKDELPSIEKIIVSNHKNSFDVFVYLNDSAVYYDYDFKERQLLEIEYDGKPIKTHFDLDSDLILYMILKADVIGDLGLRDIPLLMFDFTEGIEINEYLTKMLDSIREDYAYDMFCIENDL